MSGKRVLIVGASRGIGLEWVRQACAAGETVTATARDEAGLERLRTLGAQALKLDLLDPAACAGIAWQLDGSAFDTIVLNAGLFGPRHDAPTSPTAAEFDAVMHTNVLGAMRLAPLLLEVLAPGGRLGVISSRMGSIGLRANANGWLYRASKAALNSVLKDLALLLSERDADGKATPRLAVSLHPGWVRTDMGGADADLEPAEAVRDLRRTLATLPASAHGGFFNHDGQALAW